MSATTYTTASAIRGIKAEGVAIQAARKPRYHLRAGLQYLHMSCTKLTDQRDWAWVGTIDQARTARRRFPAAAGCKARAIQTIPVHSEEA